MMDDGLIAEQAAYYQARAAEYDEWFLRTGRYDRGVEHRLQWNDELDVVRQWLNSFAPLGTTLEIACGTGLWTGILAETSSSLMAIDSSPETMKLNRRKHPDPGINFAVANVFEWEPRKSYDTIFFGFWLSHVPQGCFETFWKKVEDALRPDAKVLFVDSLKAPRSIANDHAAPDDSGVVERRLNSGETFRIVKRFDDPAQLERRLSLLGWEGSVCTTEEFFLYGNFQHKEHGAQTKP